MTVVTHTYRFTGQGEDFGPRKGAGLVILHTWESAGNTVADALAGLKWQDRDDTAGSYNRVICVDGVVSAVPDDHISGGVNPASTYFKPRAWLFQVLAANKVNDPNSYALQLCAMGQRAAYDKAGWPPAIIDGFARCILEEEARIGGPVVVANHADFQPGNRTDAGDIAMALVKKRYAELTAEVSVADIDTFKLERIVIDAFANIRSAPAENAPLLFQNGDKPSPAISVGTKNGFHAYWMNANRAWGYTSTAANVVSAEPYQNTVEVPTGITQAQLDEAKATSFAAGFTDAKTKARISVEGIK